MNRTRLAGLLVALAGSVAGGVAIVQNVLTPGASLIVECAPDADCVMVARPADTQCLVLLEGGGDRPGETSGTEGPDAEAARILLMLMEGDAISGFRTIPSGSGCLVGVQLSRAQAQAWRQVLTGESADDGAIGEAVAMLTPASPAGFPAQWGGGSTPEQRTEAFDLATVDGGVL